MDTPLTLKAALLQALVEADGYGLDFIDRVKKKKTQNKVSIGAGSVYPALRELVDHDLATSYEVQGPPERGGRPRRYYKITNKGRRAAREQRETIASLFSLVNKTGG